ncbi:MAG TPA: hypothetical protein VEC37_16475 [Bacillota bacterium]|nr:hypothetical protein [Bacillota bacterium]
MLILNGCGGSGGGSNTEKIPAYTPTPTTDATPTPIPTGTMIPSPTGTVNPTPTASPSEVIVTLRFRDNVTKELLKRRDEAKIAFVDFFVDSTRTKSFEARYVSASDEKISYRVKANSEFYVSVSVIDTDEFCVLYSKDEKITVRYFDIVKLIDLYPNYRKVSGIVKFVYNDGRWDYAPYPVHVQIPEFNLSTWSDSSPTQGYYEIKIHPKYFKEKFSLYVSKYLMGGGEALSDVTISDLSVGDGDISKEIQIPR